MDGQGPSPLLGQPMGVPATGTTQPLTQPGSVGQPQGSDSQRVFKLGEFELQGEAQAIGALENAVKYHVGRLQSAYDQQIAELRNEVASNREAEAEQRLRSALAGRNPSEQALIIARHRMQQVEEREQSLQERLSQYEEAQERENDIQSLSQKWGAPRQLLNRASTYSEAEALAVEFYKRRVATPTIPQSQMGAQPSRSSPQVNSVPKASDPEFDLTVEYMKRGYSIPESIRLARQQTYRGR